MKKTLLLVFALVIAVAAKADNYIFQLPVTIDSTRTENFSAYVENKELHILKLFGAEADVVYTLSDDNTVSNHTKGSESRNSSGYYEDGVEIHSLQFSGNSEIAVDTLSMVVNDTVRFADTAKDHTFSFVWPCYNVLIEIKYNSDFYSSAFEGYSILYQDAIIVGSKIVIPNFLKTDFQAEFDCNINCFVTHNLDQIEDKVYLGNYYDTYKHITVTGNDAYYNSVLVEDVPDTKLLYINAYIEGERTFIFINTPSNFQLKDDYKDYAINAKAHVNVYYADAKDDDEHTDADLIKSLDVDVKAIDSSTIVIDQIFEARNLVYTIDNQGNVSTSWNKRYVQIYDIFNGVENNWVQNEEYPYLAFDAATATISHITYIQESDIYICLETQLPDSYKHTSSVANIDADGDSDAPVEYYNLQGIRVTNPTHGIYIRRQGTTATTLRL
jgi:hypothetical protein